MNIFETAILEVEELWQQSVFDDSSVYFLLTKIPMAVSIIFVWFLETLQDMRKQRKLTCYFTGYNTVMIIFKPDKNRSVCTA